MARATRASVQTARDDEELTRQALEVSRQSLEQVRSDAETTKQAFEVAERQAREATRTRIDARSPRVSVLPATPDWPPYLNMPWVGNATRAEPGSEFDLTARGGERLWFRTRILLQNDGPSTAIIALGTSSEPDAMRFERTYFDSQDIQFPVPAQIAEGRWALGPHQSGVVLLDTALTVGRLINPLPWMYGTVTISDNYDDGIEDSVAIQVRPDVFEQPNPAQDLYILHPGNSRVVEGRWLPWMEARVDSMTRTYRSEQ